MATRYALPELSVDERLEAVLGGAPLSGADRTLGDHDKHARKRRKREAKQRRDAERPPGSFERFRILSELVDHQVREFVYGGGPPIVHRGMEHDKIV